MNDKYNFMGARELAKMLGVSTATLAWRRHQGRPMPKGFQPPGSRMWRYRCSDVIAWIEGGMSDGAAASKKTGRPCKQPAAK